MNLIRKDNKSFILFLFLSPCSIAASTAFALLLQPVIDAAIASQWRHFLLYSGRAVMLGLASVLLGYVTNCLFITIQSGFTMNLRNEYMSSMLQKDVRDYFAQNPSYYLSKLTVTAKETAEKYGGSMLEI